MFSESIAQELAALLVSALAFVYLMHKIGGWPRFGKRKQAGPPVIVGERLARGLKTARTPRNNAGDSDPAQ
jgi:hypothetical protein